MKKLIKTGWVAVLAMASVSAGAQQLLPAGESAASLVRLQKTPQLNEQTAPKAGLLEGNYTKAAPQGKARSVVKRDGEAAKPGTYYKTVEGFYNLSPGHALLQNSDGTYVYSEHGVMGYIDRDMRFVNKTEKYDAIQWDFMGVQPKEDTIAFHPFFSSTGYIATPKLTATLAALDSTYQMGTYTTVENNEKKVVEGMISLSGSAWVSNIGVEATPFIDTYYTTLSGTDPWNNMLFGHDTTTKPVYVECFEAPFGGSVALYNLYFYVMTPTTVDLSRKKFSVAVMEDQTGEEEWATKAEFTNIVPELIESSASSGLRLWSVQVQPKDVVMMNNAFYVLISGPQDGTKWALMTEYTRGTSTEPNRNTAFYIPTMGENKDEFCQYRLTTINTITGEEEDFDYATSLDLRVFMITPYIIVANNDAAMSYVQDGIIDLDESGDARNYLLSDWWNTPANGVTISAKVSASTDGDWLTVSQPTGSTEVGKTNFFDLKVSAASLPFDLEGRRATVTLTDNKGFSRDVVVYQGSRVEADRILAVEQVDAQGTVTVSQEEGGYVATYPTYYTRMNAYDATGRRIGTYALDKSGQVKVNAKAWGKGIYTLQFVGAEGAQSVKVLR